MTAKVLLSFLLMSTSGQDVYRCDYFGVWEGSGHYQCSLAEPKRGDRVYRILISYPLRGVIILPEDPKLPIPNGLL